MPFPFALSLLFIVCAADRSLAGEENSLRSFVWYEKDRAHTVWLDAEHVAEFNGSQPGSEESSAVRRMFRNSSPVRTQGVVRVWKVGGAGDSEAAARSLRLGNPGTAYSPVLRDSLGTKAPMRALPGNFIVHFQLSWDESKVKAWIARNKFEVVQKLEIGPNVYVLKSEAGLASLQRANEVHASGEVVAAYPNWWRELGKR